MRRVIALIVLAAAAGWGLAGDRLAELSRKADGYKGKHDFVYLYNDADVRVHANGMSHRVERSALKVLSTAGCRRFQTLSFFYDPLTMGIRVTAAAVVRPDGTRRDVPLDAVKSYPQPARAIYWPNVRVSIPFGLLAEGDVITMEWEKKGFSYALLAEALDDSRFAPPMEGHFYDIVEMQADHPVLSTRYAVEVPAGKPIQYRVYNGTLTPAAEFTDYGMRYTFSRDDLAPLNREPARISASDVALKLLVSTTVRWEDKSEWFYRVNEDFSFKVLPEIKAKVDALVKDCRTDEEKIDVLNHWVAHYIRYSGLSMGEGEGYTLHPSDMIFRDRSGVCKDKASLLVTFLRAAGFEAYPAMTMAGARIDNFPADFFNHSVVALRQGDGTFRMLDPTWVPWVREQWSSAEQEQQYLVGYKEGQPLMTTPYSPPENHYYDLAVAGSIADDGAFTGRLTLKVEGQTDAMMRRATRANHRLEADAYFTRILKGLYPDARIAALTYNDPSDIARPLEVVIDCVIPRYALRGGGGWRLRSPALSYARRDPINSELDLHFPDADTREYGFRSRCTKLYRITESLEFPRAIAVDRSVLAPEKRCGGEFAELALAASADGATLRRQTTLSLKKRIYPAAAWKEYKDAIGAFQDAESRYVIVRY